MKKNGLKLVDAKKGPYYFGRDGSTGEISVWPTASRDENGEFRYHFTLTNAERLDFPRDFPVLVQVLSWSALCVASDTGGLKGDDWLKVCRLINKIEELFKLP
jgi:hypothetical protein